jgi:hypothetical protein
MKGCRQKWLTPVKNGAKYTFLNCSQTIYPEVEETMDAHAKDGENNFEVISYNFKP